MQWPRMQLAIDRDMKAVRIHAYGHSDQLHVEDVDMPQPDADEILVRVSAAGTNPVDWKIREGLFAAVAPQRFPFTLGQDFAGEIIAVGENVTDYEGSESVYGFANGAYAEYAVVLPGMIASKPVTVHDTIAATLPTPGLTALQLVRDVVRPRAGDTVLIHGAAGAVGSIATQLCVARQANVIATASATDAPYLQALGVARVIDYHTERFEDHARGVTAIIDLVGGDSLERSVAVMGDRGLVVTTVARKPGSRGFVARKNAADLRELAALVDAGTIRPRAARILPLDQARVAQDLSQQHRTSEKLVLEVVRAEVSR
jgi:NADPH:quinone reductase-like Zn-dependent oxidoreductase